MRSYFCSCACTTKLSKVERRSRLFEYKDIQVGPTMFWNKYKTVPVKEEILQGRYGEELRQFAESHPGGYGTDYPGLMVCQCGGWLNEGIITYVYPDEGGRQTERIMEYRCPDCGKPMKRCEDRQIPSAKIRCPMCKEYLHICASPVLAD